MAPKKSASKPEKVPKTPKSPKSPKARRPPASPVTCRGSALDDAIETSRAADDITESLPGSLPAEGTQFGVQNVHDDLPTLGTDFDSNSFSGGKDSMMFEALNMDVGAGPMSLCSQNVAAMMAAELPAAASSSQAAGPTLLTSAFPPPTVVCPDHESAIVKRPRLSKDLCQDLIENGPKPLEEDGAPPPGYKQCCFCRECWPIEMCQQSGNPGRDETDLYVCNPCNRLNGRVRRLRAKGELDDTQNFDMSICSKEDKVLFQQGARSLTGSQLKAKINETVTTSRAKTESVNFSAEGMQNPHLSKDYNTMSSHTHVWVHGSPSPKGRRGRAPKTARSAARVVGPSLVVGV